MHKTLIVLSELNTLVRLMLHIISWLTMTLADTSRIIYLATTESIVKVSNYDKKVSRPRELSCMTYIRESDFWCTSVPSRA